MLSGRDYADMWCCAMELYKNEDGLKAIPVGEVFCGSDQKGGGRDYFEWAVDMVTTAKDLGILGKLERHYLPEQNDNYQRDTVASRRYWREVRRKGGLIKQGMQIIKKVYR